MVLQGDTVGVTLDTDVRGGATRYNAFVDTRAPPENVTSKAGVHSIVVDVTPTVRCSDVCGIDRAQCST